MPAHASERESEQVKPFLHDGRLERIKWGWGKRQEQESCGVNMQQVCRQVVDNSGQK